MADDFYGTAPDGSRYTKAQELQREQSSKEEMRGCRLNDARVRWFGDNVALVYGAETAIVKGRNGTETTRCLVWTDTWLKRDGRWQVVAAQDMPKTGDCK